MNPTCPVCESKKTQKKYEIKRYSPPFVVYECYSCNSLFQFPIPPNVNSYYNKDYYSGQSEYSYVDERKQYSFYRYVYEARLKTIRKFLPPILLENKFLDVGCGFGGFALSAAQYFEAYGLDVSSYAIREGKKWLKSHPLGSKVKLFEGSLQNLPKSRTFPKKGFAVITLIEVAEHLENPRLDFLKAYELLSSGGILVIQTANFSAWQAIWQKDKYHYFMPGHLVYYSREGLKGLLAEIGFKKFQEFFPVDFPLIAKLKKARGNWKSPQDYLRAFPISWYHVKSKFFLFSKPLTSSYVLYAFRD